jgi:hypothetical protein
MKLRTFAVLLGLAMLVAGCILGIVGVSTSVRNANPFDRSIVTSEELSCSGIFDGGKVGVVPFGTRLVDAQERCDDALGSRATWVWVLMGLGVVIALGGWLIKPSLLGASAAGAAAPAGPAPDGYTPEGQPYWLNRPAQ